MFIVVELFKWYPNQIDNAIKLGDSRESCVKAFSRNTVFFFRKMQIGFIHSNPLTKAELLKKSMITAAKPHSISLPGNFC